MKRKPHTRLNPLTATVVLFLCLLVPARMQAQVTLAFQGAEPGDTWTFTSTGADAVAQAQTLIAPNIVSGTASLVVGGNTPGGNCFDVGSGNGPNTPRAFTFSNLDISTSNAFARTLQFNWGNRFPICNGTGWDSGENLVFTAFHNGVAQPPVTLAVGNNNATFSIHANQFTWNIPACVNSFYFVVSITTNRRDELLFLDDVKITTPAMNPSMAMPSPVTGDLNVCEGNTGNYNVIQVPGVIYTWSGLPAGAVFTSANGTTGAYNMGINWGTVAPGTYTISVTPSNACGATGPAQTATVTVQSPVPVSITASGPTTFCAGGSVTLTSSSAVNNNWSPGGSTANSIVVTTGGTYTLTVTGSCGAGTDSEIITINPLPVLNVNNATTCPGVPTTLSVVGATFYSWSPATGLSATTGSSVDATPPLGTTVYTVTGTDLNGCEGTATSTVTVNPIPDATITPAGPLCANNAPVTLTTASTGGNWSATCGTCISTSGQFDPSLASTGANTVTYTIPGSCGDVSSINITVNPVPNVIATPQTICSGQTTNVPLSSAVAGTSFSWTTTAVNIMGASNGSGTSITQTLDVIVPPTGSVIYNITPSAAGCTGTPLAFTVTVQDVSIDNVTVVPVSCNGLDDGSITITSSGGSSYSIDGGTSFQASNVFTDLTPGTYNIVVENASGCSESTLINVSEPAVLNMTVSGTDESCSGSCNGTATTLATGGTMPYTYTWSNGAGNVDNVSGLCSGTYTVEITDDRGCTASAGVTINFLSGVTIDSVHVDDVLCNSGNTGGLIVYTTPVASQYSIDGGTVFQPASNFTGLIEGTYYIVAEHSSGCQATTTIVIDEPAPLVLTTSNDTLVCSGTLLTLTALATGGKTPYVYTWDHGLASAPAHTITPVSNDTYSVYVTDSNGCVSPTSVISVSVPSALTVSVSGNQVICPGASAPISAIASGGMLPYVYSWTNTLNSSILTGADQLVSPNADAVYTVTVKDVCGTEVSAWLNIDLFTLPTIQFTLDTTSGCMPLNVGFTSTTITNPGDEIEWDFGDGNDATGTSVQNVYTTDGCYDLTFSVTTTDGCVTDTTVLNQVCVYPVPLAEFTFTPVPADVFNPEVSFTNLSSGASHHNWNFAGIDSSKVLHPVFAFPTDSGGTYQVCLQAINPMGCMDTTCHLVNIDGYATIYTPNAFTPDGDGLNDYFYPVPGDISRENFSFFVFDRWGKLVFEGHELSDKWDGMYNGMPCKEDTYVWKVKYREAETTVDREVLGRVTLLR